MAQQFHAGVNPQLRKRQSKHDFFNLWPVCRCDMRHGSKSSQTVPAAVRRSHGKIAASLAQFRRSAAVVVNSICRSCVDRKILETTGGREGYCPFSEPVPFDRGKAYNVAIR
jgi:hypothetical protein